MKQSATKWVAGCASGLLAGLLLTPAVAQALDYRSVAAPAVFYASPVHGSKKLYAVGRGYPVEAVVELNGWVKVRDSKGELAWVEAGNLSSQRMLVVLPDSAVLRQAPVASAPAVARLGRSVLLERLELAAGGWVKVRHRDGLVGYLQVGEVWGE